MAVSPTYGSIDPFRPDNENIVAYLERVEMYIVANSIAEDKKVPTFFSLLGGKVYSLLRSLVSPEKPSEMTLVNLTATLRKHYEPKKVIIAERFNFHRRNQAEGESITDFVAELRRLATDCEFGPGLEEALRDRLVCGLKSESIKKNYLQKRD